MPEKLYLDFETTDAECRDLIEILRERYGKEQLIIRAYYAELSKMQESSTYYIKRQSTR